MIAITASPEPAAAAAAAEEEEEEGAGVLRFNHHTVFFLGLAGDVRQLAWFAAEQALVVELRDRDPLPAPAPAPTPAAGEKGVLVCACVCQSGYMRVRVDMSVRASA